MGNLASFSCKLQILCIELFGAGGEPTSVTLKWAVRFLATNPEVQRRAQEEISRAVGQDRAVTPSDRPALPYVHALVRSTKDHTLLSK